MGQSWVVFTRDGKVSILLGNLKRNHLTGKGPLTLAEKRKLEQDRRDFEKAENLRQQKALITFGEYFKETYFPIVKRNKTPESYKAENIYFKKWIDPVIGEIPFKDIAPIQIEKIKQNLQKAKKGTSNY